MTQDIPSFFSNDYFEARQKFLDACSDRAIQVEAHAHPCAFGRDGEKLYTDVARLGPPNPSKVLTLISGTHGVEGYCGSGVQTGLLTTGLLETVTDDLGVVLIHALNPYGFAHDRRVNEDNVDLNRNYAPERKQDSSDVLYPEIHSSLVPEKWHGPEKTVADQGLERFIGKNGLRVYQAAVSGGQYSYPDGLFFGGHTEAWSWKVLRSVLAPHAGQADLVSVIDFHTGLGPHGYGELIATGMGSHLDRAMEWYNGEVTSPSAGTSTSAEITGTLGHGIPEVLSGSEVVFIALEYGTYDIQRVLEAVRADNWLYQKGNVESNLGRAIKKEIKNTFYPNQEDWKVLVWTRAVEVIQMNIERLG
ncbi:MAG: M14 family metallopeptidase [Pseudomonadota bacterium]